MKTIRIFDDNNYDMSWKRINREAVRAVIIKSGKVALIKSLKEGFYKFPGGGIEPGECHLDTLARETLEETGLSINPASVRELGVLHEIRKGFYGEEIFDQKSYYYYADVHDRISVQALDEYETEMAFVLEWADIREALAVNLRLGKNYSTPFVLREAYLMEYLLDLPEQG